MSAIPGLSSSSRLACLLSLLRSEAESATSTSAGRPDQAMYGSEAASSADSINKPEQSAEGAVSLHSAGDTNSLQSTVPSQQAGNSGSFAEVVAQGRDHHGSPNLSTPGGDRQNMGSQASRPRIAPIKAAPPEQNSQAVSAHLDVESSSATEAATADQRAKADAQSATEESESLNSFISMEAEPADVCSSAASVHESSLATRAIIFVAEEVTAHR